MRRFVRAWAVVGVLAALFVGAPQRAHADPDISKLFDNVTLELRGLSGAAGGLGTSFVNGGDVHLGIEVPSFAFALGARLGAAGSAPYLGPRGAQPSAAQFLLVDVGCRGFLSPRASVGYFLGGGLGLGWTYVDGYAFENASLYGLYAEAGVELPRTSPLRFTAALRLDAGVTSRAEFSRVPDAGAVVMFTANVGFLLGGPGTASDAD